MNVSKCIKKLYFLCLSLKHELWTISKIRPQKMTLVECGFLVIHSIQPTSLVIFTLGGLAFHNARSISTSPLLRILLGLTLGFSIAFSIFVYVCYLLFPRDNGIGRNAAIFAVISGAISFSMVTEGILSFVQRYMEWLMAIKYGGYPAGVLFIVFCSALGVAWVFAYDVLKSENTQRFVKYFIQMSAALVMLVSIEGSDLILLFFFSTLDCVFGLCSLLIPFTVLLSFIYLLLFYFIT